MLQHRSPCSVEWHRELIKEFKEFKELRGVNAKFPNLSKFLKLSKKNIPRRLNLKS